MSKIYDTSSDRAKAPIRVGFLYRPGDTFLISRFSSWSPFAAHLARQSVVLLFVFVFFMQTRIVKRESPGVRSPAHLSTYPSVVPPPRMTFLPSFPIGNQIQKHFDRVLLTCRSVDFVSFDSSWLKRTMGQNEKKNTE